MAWYKEWFGQEYLELYSYRDASEARDHIDFVEKVVGAKPDGRVLDLACGAGRHTRELRARGFDAVGVDLSLALLAQEGGWPRAAGDMSRLPLRSESFSLVLNFFTSFGYFATERENFCVLEEIARLLVPGGRFMMDLFNSEKVISELVPAEEREIDGRTVRIRRWFDEQTKRVNKEIVIDSGSGEPRTFLESVRAYRPEEVEIGMAWAGLVPDGRLGSFAGETFDTNSPRLILTGHRPA